MDRRRKITELEISVETERDCVRRTSRSAGMPVARGNDFDTAGSFDVLRLGVATAALQPQRGCSIQPSVGRRSRATLGYDSTMKTTLKELKPPIHHSGFREKAAFSW